MNETAAIEHAPTWRGKIVDYLSLEVLVSDVIIQTLRWLADCLGVLLQRYHLSSPV